MTATPSYAKVLTGFTITNPGADYTAPTITITGGGGQNASVEAIVTDGKITALNIVNQGTGFTSVPAVQVEDSTGAGAIIEAIIGDIDYKNKLEYLIQEQLPEFVQNEYSGFVTFLEAYYRFLDQSGQANNVLLNAKEFSDVDKTLDVFVEQFRRQYAIDIPRTVLVNQRRLIKLIREFYDSKGAEDSMELLFKILYDESIEFFYPSRHILKASDGVWVEDVVIRIVGADTNANPFDLVGTICDLVYYENTGTQIFPKTIEVTVSDVKKLAYTQPPIYELIVSLPKNSPLKVPGAGAVAEAQITDGQITAIDILDGGSGYYAAPTVVLPETDGTGAKFRANISNGVIESVTVLTGGSGYTEANQVLFLTDSIRTNIYLHGSTSVYGHVIRQLSSVEVLSCDGEGVEGDCGFRVGQIYQIDELSTVGPYVIDPPLATPTPQIIDGIDANPDDYGTYDPARFDEDSPYFDAEQKYTLVGRDNRASVRVTSIDETGCVAAVEIFNTGFDFEKEYFETTITSPTGCVATLAFTTGAVLVKSGRFKDSRGMLSDSSIRLQDNYYYQNYSYVIRSGVPSNYWTDILKRTAHPAGMAVFGELIITQNVSMSDFIGVVEYVQLHETFIDIAETGQQVTVDFFKILTETVSTGISYYAAPDYAGTDYAYDDSADLVRVDFHKVLSDAVTVSESTNFLYDVGFYDAEEDNASMTETFSVVVSYFRDFLDGVNTTIDSYFQFGKVIAEDPVWATRDFWAVPDYGGLEFAWDAEETVNVAFGKVLQDYKHPTDQINSFDIGKVLQDYAETAQSLGFTVNKILNDSVTVSDNKNIATFTPRSDATTSIDDAAVLNSVLNKTELATTFDYYNKVLQLSKSEDSNISDVVLVDAEEPTIDLVGIDESSRMIINKGIGDLLGITDSGIINTQDYVNGDFGSDYVGQATYF